MRFHISCVPFVVFAVFCLNTIEARRIRVRPVQSDSEEDETYQYYAAEPQDEEQQQQQQVVLVSAADRYNGLYGQPSASSRSAPEPATYIRKSSAAPLPPRSKEAARPPPVQTIRNYNKVNDDGSFTFGYEAADGSFKEETRGTDCVVRGKYGYVDPDGNKREFTYVSGNPCDPNAPKDEEEQQEQEQESDSPEANYPRRPIVAPKPVTFFQNNYQQHGEEEQVEPEQILRQQPVRRPAYITRPQYVQQSPSQDSQVYQIPSTTPSSILYKQQTVSAVNPVSITPRPVSPTQSARTQLPATTYRPQLISVTPRPSLLYTKHLQAASPTGVRSGVDFDAEFQRFQQENNVVGPTPSPASAKKVSKPDPGQIYSSALVYDPSSGQYNTQLYQTLPQTEGDFTLSQRIQPYVHQPQRQLVNLPQYSRPVAAPSQAVYQQQQSGLQYQNSAQLYAQQQRARLQGQQQRVPQAQPLYYLQPSSSLDQPQAVGTSQIDAFLRGHNIQF